MLKQKKEAEKEALEEELNAYERIINARKKLLDQQKEEREYQDTIKDKNKEIANIQGELLEIQFDTSEEAKARRLQLEEELAARQEELDDIQYNESVDQQQEALDDEYDAFEEMINDKLKLIEDYLKESGTIQSEAIALLQGKTDEFYNSLLEWNRRFGTGVDEDIVGAWKRAFDAAAAYQQAVANIGSTGGGGSGTEITEPVENPNQGNLVGQRIRTTVDSDNKVEAYLDNNASEQAGFLPGGRYYTIRKFEGGSSAPYQVYDLATQQLVWLKSRSIETPQFHSGLDQGFVGGKSLSQSNEQFAKLLKGEIVVNSTQMDNFLKDILPRTIEASSNQMGGFNIEKMIEITIQGNLDKSVLPDLQNIVNAAVAKMNDMLKQRGHTRNAVQYSI
jgi:hypothetical protein